MCDSRDGTLRVGDEIVNVNGRRLRGLSMATAREILRSGPIEVDIVVARAEMEAAQTRRSGMRESSVDYENVVLKPRAPEPVVSDSPEPESLTAFVESFKPTICSSPIANRFEVKLIFLIFSCYYFMFFFLELPGCKVRKQYEFQATSKSFD